MVHTTDQLLGKNVMRKSFSKTRTTLEIPNLIEIQTKSYKWFLDEGLMEVLRDVSRSWITPAIFLSSSFPILLTPNRNIR